MKKTLITHNRRLNHIFRAATLITSLLCLSNGTCLGVTPDKSAEQHLCSDFAQLRDGAYLYVNNMWGAYQQPDKTYWSQCLDYHASMNGTHRYVFTWHWPHVEQQLQAPFGFPSVSFGKNPNFPGASTTSLLPAKVSAVRKLSAQASTSISTSGAYDEFYNIFYVSDTNPAAIANSVTTELAIVIRHREQAGVTGFPFQQHVKDITVGHQIFGLYVNPAFTPLKAARRVLAFLVPQQMPLHGMIDIKAITAVLIGQRYVNENDYIANVDLGVEIYNSPEGSDGHMEISHFAVAVERE